MINTTHYNLQKAEANDIVNGLLPANTNLDKIDTAMFNNLNSGVHNASHTKTGTVHALVRTVTTANFFKFSATDDFRTGDTFTLDGEVITARTQAYAGLPDYAFRTGSEVIAITDHGVLTIYCAGDNITVDDALSPTSENPVQNKVIDGALSAIEDDVTAVANKVGSAPLQTVSQNCSGAINELNTHINDLGDVDELIPLSGSAGDLTTAHNISDYRELLFECVNAGSFSVYMRVPVSVFTTNTIATAVMNLAGIGTYDPNRTATFKYKNNTAITVTIYHANITARVYGIK